MRFLATDISDAERAFRDEVRVFLAAAVPEERRTLLGMSGPGGHDPDFSRLLGECGWLGMTLPEELGGQGRGAVRRLLLTEELLAAQAPISAHWVADRQSAPVIASHGTRAQQARFIPEIVKGTSWFSIGMSEPDSGSDLASVKTAATRVPGGWSVSGTKVWTTNAQHNHWFIVLCRTSPGKRKHEGLSQLLVNLRSPGIQIRPITTLDGEQEFCEVVLDEVFVPEELLLGEEGDGWAQCTGELAFERGGPDRYLSAWALFAWLVSRAPEGAEEEIGRLCARYRVVRALALSAARSLERGGSPATEAAVTKDLGTLLELDTIEAVRTWLRPELDLGSVDRLTQLAARAVLTAPTFTLRGGTTEVLRTLVGRSAGVPVVRDDDDLVGRTVDRIIADHCSPRQVREHDGAVASSAWQALSDSGLVLVGVSEEAGGSGGGTADAAKILQAVGASAASMPLSETCLIGGWALAAAGLPARNGPLAVALQHDLVLVNGALQGTAHRVAFAENGALVLAIVGDRLVGFEAEVLTVGRALNGETRCDIRPKCACPLLDVEAPCSQAVLVDRFAATRVLLIAGALRSTLRLTDAHASTREQFGQPINRFQAISHQVALLAEQVARAEMAADLATRWLDGKTDRADLGVATVTARESGTLGARLAHQVHGAMGVAREHDLHLFTRCLWVWRDEGGAEQDWARDLGRSAIAAGQDLWSWTSR